MDLLELEMNVYSLSIYASILSTHSPSADGDACMVHLVDRYGTSLFLSAAETNALVFDGKNYVSCSGGIIGGREEEKKEQCERGVWSTMIRMSYDSPAQSGQNWLPGGEQFLPPYVSMATETMQESIFSMAT